MAKTAKGMPVFLLRVLLSEERMTKPESQKTGIETINPVRFMLRGALFFPIRLSNDEASTLVPPLFSRNAPIIVPRAMIIPILERVLPKPSLIFLSTVAASMMPWTFRVVAGSALARPT